MTKQKIVKLEPLTEVATDYGDGDIRSDPVTKEPLFCAPIFSYHSGKKQFKLCYARDVLVKCALAYQIARIATQIQNT